MHHWTTGPEPVPVGERFRQGSDELAVHGPIERAGGLHLRFVVKLPPVNSLFQCAIPEHDRLPITKVLGSGGRHFHRFQYERNSVEDLANSLSRQSPHLLRKLFFGQGKDLRYIYHAIFRQVGFCFIKQQITGTFCPGKIGRDGAHDHCSDSAVVEEIALNNDNRADISLCRSDWLAEISPIDVPLDDHHSPSIRVRCLPLMARNKSSSSGSSPSA